MKQDRHVIPELSAYLDGEARAPGRIAEHLAQCPACARRLEEMLRVRDALRALPAPAPRPGFDARVLAAVQSAPAPRRWPVLLAPAAALAAVAVVAALLFMQAPAPVPGRTAVTVDTPDEPVRVDLRWQDDIAVVEELAALADAGANLSDLLLEGLTEEGAAYEEEAAALVFDLLAAAHAAGDPAAPWDAFGPWSDDVGLDAAETADFARWLEAWDRGGERS